MCDNSITFYSTLFLDCLQQALPTLVRMCKSDKTWEERVEGAETLAHLIEVDLSLQRMTAMSDNIISTLAEYFKYPGCPLDSTLIPRRKVRLVIYSLRWWKLLVYEVVTSKVSTTFCLIEPNHFECRMKCSIDLPRISTYFMPNLFCRLT